MALIVQRVMEVQALNVERRMREVQIAAEQHEARWGGIRSIAIFTAISGIMVMTMVVGAMA